MTLRVKAHPFQDRDIFPEWLISVHHNSKKRPRLSVQSEPRGLHSVVSSVLAACSTLRRARSGSHPRTKNVTEEESPPSIDNVFSSSMFIIFLQYFMID